MIKANELRLGNLVTDEFYSTFNTIITVNSINSKGINLNIEDDGNFSELADRWIEPEYEFNQLFGIPISPEILQKFGFDMNPNWYKYDGAIAVLDLGYLYLAMGVMGRYVTLFQNDNTSTGKNIEYLHQLQNLFFDIKDKELLQKHK